MGQQRIIIMGISLLMLTLFLVGCKGDKLDEEKIKNIEYTVTSEDRLPEELKVLVDGKKQQPFKMTYQDGDYLFICQGYGTQPSGGYSIQVEDVYQTSNAIYFSSTLIGPSQAERKLEKETTPYIVIKTEYQDMTVVFD
ncbi:MAG: protease complex subunit PrcB family protein [Lachnospiraceae bacterium]|nr:protease complex subunit PrcB family protein [Lachnospiraceae bacterium]